MKYDEYINGIGKLENEELSELIFEYDYDELDIELTPGNGGRDCLGNGKYFDENGEPIEIRCENCEHYILCQMDVDWDENDTVNSREGFEEYKAWLRENFGDKE